MLKTPELGTALQGGNLPSSVFSTDPLRLKFLPLGSCSQEQRSLTGLRGVVGALGAGSGCLCPGDFDDMIHDKEFLDPLPLTGPYQSYTVQRNRQVLYGMEELSPKNPPCLACWSVNERKTAKSIQNPATRGGAVLSDNSRL